MRKKQTDKVISSLFLCLVLVCSLVMNIKAADQQPDKIVTETFMTDNKDQEFNFPITVHDETGNYELIDVDYEVLSAEPVTAEKSITDEIREVSITRKKLAKTKESDTGQQLKLINTEYKPVKVSLGKDGYADIQQIITVTGYDIAQQITVPYTDPETGAEVEVDLTLSDQRQIGAVEAEHRVSMIFYNVDAPYFVFEDTQIPNDTENVPISGYESLYMTYLGLDPSLFYITGGEWDGEAYLQDGELCRNAVCNLIEQIPVYEVTYGDEHVLLPQVDGFEVIGTYSGTEETKTGDTMYTIQATGKYQLVIEDIEDGLSAVQVILISFALAVLIILIIVILYVISKKKKKER